MAAGHFSYYHLLPNGEQLAHVYGAIAVSAVVLGGSLIAARKLKHAALGPERGLVPDSKLTYKNFFEIIAERLYAFVESTMGHHDAQKFFPFIGSLFLFVFISNLSGSIPGFAPPTDNLNTTLALGLTTFLYYNWVGLKSNGPGYLKHFLGPLLPLAPLMFVIELISHCVRPFSLGLRLRGNIAGDHLVLGTFTDLTVAGAPAGAFGILIPFMALGLFVAFIQAFVFSLLAMIYISLASEHDH
jgi:F-type H+-transporting ATPase subunit a